MVLLFSSYPHSVKQINKKLGQEVNTPATEKSQEQTPSVVTPSSKEEGKGLHELKWHFATEYKYSDLSSAYGELVCVAVLQDYKLYQL